MRDNNTYTGDGDDLDLVTLEKINTEKKEKEIEREGGDKVGGKKKKEAGKRNEKNSEKSLRGRDRSHQYSNQQMHRGRKREEEKGTHSTNTAAESENNSLENKQSCHSNKHGWLEIQQQYTAGRNCGLDPAPKSAPHYNKAFYGKVRSVHSK